MMMRFFIRLAILFAWRTVRDEGSWVYQENEITLKRRAIRNTKFPPYQPMGPYASNWLRGHDWVFTPPSPPPPSKDH